MNAPLIVACSDTVRYTTQVSASPFPSRDGIPLAVSGEIPRLWIVTSSKPTGQPPTAFADAPARRKHEHRQAGHDGRNQEDKATEPTQSELLFRVVRYCLEEREARLAVGSIANTYAHLDTTVLETVPRALED